MVNVMSTSDGPEEVFKVMYDLLINNSFDRMKTYVKESHDLMRFKKDQMMVNFKEELEVFPNAQGLTTRVYAEHFENYDRQFIAILMNSAFISAYTLFEVIFEKICNFAESRYKLRLSASELSGNGIIGKSKKYIEKVAGVNLDAVGEYWKQIDTCRKLRNSIIHEQGVVKSTNNFLTQHVRSHAHIALFNPIETSTTTFYIKDTQFVIEFCELAHDYLSYVLQELVKIKLSDSIGDRTT